MEFDLRGKVWSEVVKRKGGNLKHNLTEESIVVEEPHIKGIVVSSDVLEFLSMEVPHSTVDFLWVLQIVKGLKLNKNN